MVSIPLVASGAATERRSAANEKKARGRLAMIAFLAHAPGLYVLGRRPMSEPYKRWNLVALAATTGAMVGAGLALHERGLAGVGVAVAWLIGHTAWSVALARGVLTGSALEERRRAPRGRS
jgi:hypothetical protein